MSFRTMFAVITLLIFVASCGGGGGSNPASVAPPTDPNICTNTSTDSQANMLFVDGRIRAHKNGTHIYHNIATVRQSSVGTDISIDYMVHTPSGTTKGIIVLIAGGNSDSKIEGTDGNPATRSSGNFLIRSAHLFAENGYKVISLDRPSDWSSYTGYDDYRISVKHAVDISTIINAENGSNLPVIIAGTSRGAISAVSQAKLADAISLSSPVTSGSGFPVSESGSVKPGSVTVPAHVMWHVNDACGVSTPTGSSAIVSDFNPDASSNSISGGFSATDGSDCGGSSPHGFYGIETCATGLATGWIDGLSLPDSKPTAGSSALNFTQATGAGIDISGLTSSANGGALTITLPYSATTLGGTISIADNTVLYNPPALNGVVDSFVYIVEEAGGGKSHNVLTIALP